MAPLFPWNHVRSSGGCVPRPSKAQSSTEGLSPLAKLFHLIRQRLSCQDEGAKFKSHLLLVIFCEGTTIKKIHVTSLTGSSMVSLADHEHCQRDSDPGDRTSSPVG